LQNSEEAFQREVAASVPDTRLAIHKQLQRVVTNIKNDRNSRNSEALKKEFPKGMAMFNATCQTCHGADGNGVNALGPPLNGSEWVTGRKDKLISIVLFGLTGPIHVKGHLYKAPEITGDMPGIGYNKDLSNEDIAQLLSFIRKSWQNNAEKISAEEVTKVRENLRGRQKAFTEEELNQL
jgi:mono/diheme cytochrome c family protein